MWLLDALQALCFNRKWICKWSPSLLQISQKESLKKTFLLGDCRKVLLFIEMWKPWTRKQFFWYTFIKFLTTTNITAHKDLKNININWHILLNLFSSTSSILGNETATFSDHLPQFLSIPDFFTNTPPSKSSIFTHI